MKQGNHFSSSPFPSIRMVLISRFKDIVYLVGMHLPEFLLPVVREGITHPLHFVYGLKLKWEVHVDLVAWGEGKLAQLG